MPRSRKDLLTVSPPTFDRCAFQRLDRRLRAPHAPFDRDWIMARFSEGLQIRMLRAPLSGFVLFQPGRLCWRPVHGAEQAVVVHDLRVGEGPEHVTAARKLWAGVEEFARYYGYSAMLALTGEGAGLVAPHLAPGRGWMTLDRTATGVRLWGQILQGPVALPSLPQDWAARAAALGSGLVLQLTGESAPLERRAASLIAAAEARGVTIRCDVLRDPEQSRHRAVTPSPAFSLVRDGVVIGDADTPDRTLLARAFAA